MMAARPIPVITGLGVVSPVGIGSASFWDALMHGRSGVRPVRGFDTSPFAAHIGCEIDDDRLPPLDIQPAPRTGRAARLAALAAQEAVAHAALPAALLPATGLCIGTTMGEACWLESWSPEQVRAGPAAVPAEELLRSGPDQVGLDVAALLGLGGSIAVLAAACAAGNYAIGRAADLIRLGRAERVLAG